MIDKLIELKNIIEELETFGWVLNGGYNGSETTDGDIKAECILYQSTVEDLSKLLSQISTEFGELKIKDLEVILPNIGF